MIPVAVKLERLSLEEFPAPAPDLVISITNTVMPPEAFFDVYYVADAATTITNFDGTINGGLAFFIDSPNSFGGFGCGVNCPLVSESLILDGIWQPTETWEIVLQDYSNTLGIPPEALGSIGVPSGASGGTGPSSFSSGSIVVTFFDEFFFGPVGGTEIPVDTTTLLLAGVQSISMWMIPVVAAVAVIGVFVIKRRQ